MEDGVFQVEVIQKHFVDHKGTRRISTTEEKILLFKKINDFIYDLCIIRDSSFYLREDGSFV